MNGRAADLRVLYVLSPDHRRGAETFAVDVLAKITELPQQ